MMCKVTLVSMSELINDPMFDDLVEEYRIESSIEGMGHANWNKEIYAQLDKVGIMHLFAAHGSAGNLVGFMVVLLTVVPHYGALTATTESLFVGSRYRDGGAGLLLIKEAERFAKDRGAIGLLLSAPHGGTLSKVAPRLGYRQTNDVFFKGLT
jgi:GNAT superfamily N-acetyltransferase